MLTVIVTITGRSMCNVSSYCDKKRGGLYVVLPVIVTIMTITGMHICSANNYCDNSGEVYVQC